MRFARAMERGAGPRRGDPPPNKLLLPTVHPVSSRRQGGLRQNDGPFVQRGRLGVAFQPMSPALAKALSLDSPKGALVAEVAPGGPGARAGLKEGDVIVAVNGALIAHAEDLPKHVARHAPGSTITVTVIRAGQRRDVTATLDALDDDDTPRRPARAKPQPSPIDGRMGVAVSDAPEGACIG